MYTFIICLMFSIGQQQQCDRISVAPDAARTLHQPFILIAHLFQSFPTASADVVEHRRTGCGDAISYDRCNTGVIRNVKQQRCGSPRSSIGRQQMRPRYSILLSHLMPAAAFRSRRRRNIQRAPVEVEALKLMKWKL